MDWVDHGQRRVEQKLIPQDKYMDEDVPYASDLPTIFSPPLDCSSKAYVYIDDTTTIISIDDPSITSRAQAAVPLEIKIVERPLLANEPIPRQDLIYIEKLQAEGRMEVLKTYLGWHFETCRLIVALSDDK